MTAGISWLGLSAVYAPDERALMAELTIREQTYIHALKALTKGEIQDCVGDSSSDPRTVKAGPPLDTRSGDAVAQEVPITLYADPEDIPFGDPAPPPRRKRSDTVVVLRWTWNKGRQFKTKKAAHLKMKVWRRWYERQGWTVKGYGEQMIATSPSGERHAITLRVHLKK